MLNVGIKSNVVENNPNTRFIAQIQGSRSGVVARHLVPESRRLFPESNQEDMLYALLEISSKRELEFTREDILHLLVDLFVAGADSSSTTVEWVMAQLIKNPTKVKKAQNELTTVLGKERHVRESDIPHLPYLQSVIKETFRLHPVTPLLVPHKAEADVDIPHLPYLQILVNVWAIGRDSSIWSDPDSFVPERFLDGKIDVKGRDFTLIPFGSGRRMCPGMSSHNANPDANGKTIINNPNILDFSKSILLSSSTIF